MAPEGRQELVAGVVAGMFDCRNDFTVFKNHMRDFLVQTKQFSTGDNREVRKRASAQN